MTVTDNGPGMPAEVVEQLLDFGNNVSDKASYRSPTRGMQGNAFKTLLGIPYALGVTEPLVIEAHGTRHEVGASLDPGGNVVIRHDTSPSTRTVGTVVTVPLPTGLIRAEDAGRWLQNFACVNPHALIIDHGHTDSGEGAGIYKPTAPERWRKPLPSDPTSAHHYDQAALNKLVFAHIRAHQQGGRDLTLREFVNSFTGLTGSAKSKAVTAMVPGIARLSDFQAAPQQVAVLLAAMRQHSKIPQPTSLGQVDRTHYEQVLHQAFGVEEFWFDRKRILDRAGIPWVIEVAVARTTRPGDVRFAVNYSATFGDPLASTLLPGKEISTVGVRSFLGQADACPNYSNQHQRAVILHLICPVPQFTDKGKTALVVPSDVAQACAQALTTATRVLHKDKRSTQHAERIERRTAQREEKTVRVPKATVKDVVFTVMAQAVDQARGREGLPFSSHTLFYKLRPLALKLLPPGTAFRAHYVEQKLIPAWEREHGPITGLYREPRGTLHHPHDWNGERDVRLGTREVKHYAPAKWSYNKVLVIEKTGLWPPIDQARLADKYDMAVITNEGYTSTAGRDLLASLPPGDVQIFVLHDADPDGYNIARTLGEETARMPDHNIQVIDLGLTVDDAIAKGLESEPATRDQALPTLILPRLSKTATQWFQGQVAARDVHGKPRQWRYQRVELNAFSSPQLIAYIEEGLARHGALGKVIPPGDVILQDVYSSEQASLTVMVKEAIAKTLPIDAIEGAVRAELGPTRLSHVTADDITAYLAAHPTSSWGDAVSNQVNEQIREHTERLEAVIDRHIAEYASTSGQ